jgi:hypothetical protein
MKKKKKFVSPVDFNEYRNKEKQINKIIDELGAQNVMLCLYQREDFIIPNWYSPDHIASMWNVSLESVQDNWGDIQYMFKKTVEQGGFTFVAEQKDYLDEWDIELEEDLVESEN